MPLSVFIEMTLSAIVTVWSPGPNNILLLSTASKYGISGNIRFMTGIWSGSLTLMCLSGLFCSTLGKIIPGIQPVMKYLGAAYVLYLAWQTWRRIPPSDNVQDKSQPADGIFPAADKCKDHHLWADHVFRLYSAL